MKQLIMFPKELATRSAWIKFCSLNEATDNVNNLFICSSHFLPTDYIDPRAIELGNNLRLLPKRVPSLGKRKKLKKHNLNEFSNPGEGTSKSVHVPILQPKSEALEIVLPKLEAFEEGEQKPEITLPKCEAFEIALPKSEPLEEGEQNPEVALSKLEAFEEGEQTPEIALLKLEALEEGEQKPEIALPKSKALEMALPKPEPLEEGKQKTEMALPKPVGLEEGEQTPKKRRFSEPRYVGDVKLSDLETPCRAKMCWHIAKTKINHQASQIKVLKQKNRRLSQKVRTLKDLLDDLHKKKLIFLKTVEIT